MRKQGQSAAKPNVGRFNDYLEREYSQAAGSAGRHYGDDIVSSAWKHAAVLIDAKCLASISEENGKPDGSHREDIVHGQRDREQYAQARRDVCNESDDRVVTSTKRGLIGDLASDKTGVDRAPRQ